MNILICNLSSFNLFTNLACTHFYIFKHTSAYIFINATWNFSSNAYVNVQE